MYRGVEWKQFMNEQRGIHTVLDGTRIYLEMQSNPQFIRNNWKL
jgi:hypothetical protein